MSLFAPPPSPPTNLGRYRLLSPTASVRVSPLALGAMSIGDSVWKTRFGDMDRESSFKLLDAYYDNGGNFIDTANSYQDQTSEQLIGEWAEKRGIRDQLVIATKYTTNLMRGRDNVAQQVNYLGNGTKSLHLSLESSLKNLRTSYIDILYLHWWDWETSIPEVMNSLHNLVAQGKVLYLGISDSPAWVVSKANQYARDHGKTPFVIYQGAWSVMDRSFEREIIPMARAEGMALAPFRVLGTGKLRTDAEEQRRRESNEKGRDVFGTGWERSEIEVKMSHALEKVASEVGAKSITSVAIAYVSQKVPYVFPIIGGRKVEHLLANIEALSITLSPEQITYLESIVPFELGFPYWIIGTGSAPSFFITNRDHCDATFIIPDKIYPSGILRRVCNQGDPLTVSLEERQEVVGLYAEANDVLDRFRVEREKLSTLVMKLDRGMVKFQKYTQRCIDMLDHCNVVKDSKPYQYAPIFRLPEEILGEIFCHFLDDIFHRQLDETDIMSSNTLNFGRESKRLDMLTLGQVCMRWRQTAQSHPKLCKLWSLISLDVTSKRLTEKQAMDVLNVHLRRSGTHPLTLRLKGSTNCATVAEKVIVRLLQHSHRWLRASFTLPNNIWENQHIWIWRPSEGFPILQELSIAGNDRQGRIIPHFNVAPCLRTVTLKGPSLLPTIPWSQIFELTLSCVTFTSTITLIKSCPQLTWLTIDSCVLPENASFQVSHPFALVFSDIEHLSIENHYRDEPCTSVLANLLHRLVLPRLTSLSVKAANAVRRPGPNGNWPHSELVALLARSNCQLKTLNFKSPITSDEFLALISLVPTLETLIVEEQHASSPLIFSPPLLRDYLTHISDLGRFGPGLIRHLPAV